LPVVTSEEGQLRVPFDPSQVVENLRRERYAGDSRGIESLRQRSWQRPYYSLRRFCRPPAAGAPANVFRDWKTHSFPRWPVDNTVDQVLEHLLLLSLRARGVTSLPFVWFWPDGAPSCAIVTHDVETVVGRDRSSWLMDLDDSYGIKASFQIVPEERYAVSPAFLDGIKRRGFEINVHDLNHDGRLFSDREEFQRRAQRINQYALEFGARGFRSGSVVPTPDWYEALKISYDMSIPNAGQLEIQRGGCCTVMPYFIGDIVELPLTTTQDYSLSTSCRTSRTTSGRIRWRPSWAGTARELHRPPRLSERGNRNDRSTEICWITCPAPEAGRCWVALPGEVERWWRQRSQMTLLRMAMGGASKGRGGAGSARVRGARRRWARLPRRPASPNGEGTSGS